VDRLTDDLVQRAVRAEGDITVGPAVMTRFPCSISCVRLVRIGTEIIKRRRDFIAGRAGRRSQIEGENPMDKSSEGRKSVVTYLFLPINRLSPPRYSRRANLSTLPRRQFLRFAIDVDVPPGLFHEAEHHAEPEAGALAERFGREEWIEDSRLHVGRHAGPGVAHLDRHVIARRRARRPRKFPLPAP
jgi:hypothetical protein